MLCIYDRLCNRRDGLCLLWRSPHLAVSGARLLKEDRLILGSAVDQYIRPSALQRPAGITFICPSALQSTEVRIELRPFGHYRDANVMNYVSLDTALDSRADVLCPPVHYNCGVYKETCYALKVHYALTSITLQSTRISSIQLCLIIIIWKVTTLMLFLLELIKETE